MNRVLIHRARWDGPDLGPDWAIWNAPRPLLGERTWEGVFAHGVFYAAQRLEPRPLYDACEDENRRLDAYTVRLVSNADVERMIFERTDEGGYDRAEVLDVGLSEMAASYGLPWSHEGCYDCGRDDPNGQLYYRGRPLCEPCRDDAEYADSSAG